MTDPTKYFEGVFPDKPSDMADEVYQAIRSVSHTLFEAGIEFEQGRRRSEELRLRFLEVVADLKRTNPEAFGEPTQAKAAGTVGLEAYLDKLCAKHYDQPGNNRDRAMEELWRASRSHPEWPGERDNDDDNELSFAEGQILVRSRWNQEDRRRHRIATSEG